MPTRLGVGIGVPFAERLANFTPLQVANSAFIYHSSLSGKWQDTGRTVVAATSDPVATLDDLTANARHVSISTPTRRPRLDANIFGSKPGLYFTGDDVLALLSSLWSQTGGSLWMVFKTDSIDPSTFRRMISVRKSADFDFDQPGAYEVTAGPSSSQTVGLASGIGAPNSMVAGINYANLTGYLLQCHFAAGLLTVKMAGTTTTDTYTVTDTITPAWMTFGAQRINSGVFQEFFSGWLGYMHGTTSIASASDQALMQSYTTSDFSVAA